MTRDFKGVWIPKEVWLTEDLSLQEKVFLIEIDSLDNENGCYANNTYFSNFFGISVTRVSLVIKKLIEKGYVTSEIKVKEGNKRILKTSLTKVKDPRKLSLKHNNTFNNTFNNTTIKEEKINFSPSQIKLDEVIIEVETEKKEKEKSSAQKEKVIAFTEIKDSFLDYYQDQTGIEYSFTAKDAGSIKYISKKIQHSIQSDGSNITSTAVVDNFNAILNQLPKWYKEKGLSLTVINSKYNEIITEIRTSSNNGINISTIGASIDKLVKD